VTIEERTRDSQLEGDARSGTECVTADHDALMSHASSAAAGAGRRQHGPTNALSLRRAGFKRADPAAARAASCATWQ
jgi:hypothetical protein